jgi:putative redox protein
VIYLKVFLELSEGIHFIASARDFTNIHLDEPESFHGQNKGPSAVEYFLIGIGGCTGSTFAYCLMKNAIQVQKLEVIVDGTLGHKGKNMNLRLKRIDLEIKCSTKEVDKTKLEKCLAQFKDHCVITKSITKGIPLEYTFDIHY